MSTQQRLRQPAGIPVGGQFAPDPNSFTAAEIELGGVGDPAWQRSASAEITDDAELLDVANKLAARIASRSMFSGMDSVREELVGDTLALVMEQKAKRPDMRISRGYVSMVMNGFASKHASDGLLSNESRKAKGIWLKLVDKKQQELGRLLTVSEEDRLAEDLRENWVSTRRHRPVQGFHRIERHLSIDAPNEESGDSVVDYLTAQLEGSGGEELPLYEEDSAMAQALMAVQSGDASAKPKRWQMYNILAETMDAPRVASGSVSTARCAKSRTLIEQAGGVSAVARMWEQGEDTDATEALFTPFGEVDGTGREKIVDLLLKNPAYSEDVWMGALSLANTRNKAKQAAA